MSATDASPAIGAPRRVQDLRSIERVLEEMWRVAAEQEAEPDRPDLALARICLGNLVVVADRGRSDAISEDLVRLSARRPSRVLMVEVDPEREAEGIVASISAVCHKPHPGAPKVCCEQIRLACGPVDFPLLAGIVTPLLEPDLPSLLWWDRETSDGRQTLERLAREVDAVLIDSDRAQSTADLALMGELSAVVSIRDLAWTRIEPWRRELSRVFDDRAMLATLGRLNKVCVGAIGRPGAGPPASALLMAGWLVGQLGWEVVSPLRESGSRSFALARGPRGQVFLEVHACSPPADWAPRTAAMASLTAVALAAGDEAEVRLDLSDDGLTLTVAVRLRDSCPLPHRASGATRPLDEVVGAILESPPGPEPVYDRAMRCALTLVGQA